MRMRFLCTLMLIVLLLILGCIGASAANMDFVAGSFLYQEDSYLLGIPEKTSCNAVADNFEGDKVSFKDINGKAISGDSVVGTGTVVSSARDLTVVIMGDVNGDGKVLTADYIIIKKTFSSGKKLTGVVLKAADISGDGIISSIDYIRVKKNFNRDYDLYDGMNATPYQSQFTKVEYDTSSYRMDRSKINIGVFEFTKAISDDEHMKAYKETFGGDFILLGSNSSTFYKMCEKYQVGFFAKSKNLTRYTYGNAADNLDPTSFEDIETKLAAYKDNYEYCWGDDVFDEPQATYFDWMQGANERYQAKFNDRFIFYNLNPFAPSGPSNGHGAANYRDYIAQYVEKVDTDYICFDIYPFNNQFDGMHVYYLENLDVVAAACRETGRDFWIITQTGSIDTSYQMNASQVSWQMYTALAYGAKSIIHACYTPCWWVDGTSLVNEDGTYTDLWYSTSKLNQDIHALSSVYMQYENLGVSCVTGSSFVTAQLRKQNVRNAERGYDGTRGFKNIEADNGLIVGSFEKKDGNGYAMMLVDSKNAYDTNVSTKVTFSTADSSASKVTAYINGESQVLTSVDGVYTVTLTSGQGCFVTVE